MNRSIIYLIYFTIYSLILLIIGKGSFRKSNTVDKFFICERNLGVIRLFFTFTGTWISAATILGVTGSVYEIGYTTIIYSVLPWFIGAFMLYGISGKLYEQDLTTIPQLFRKKYNSKGLQIIFAIIIIVCYILYLVIQIKGFGIVAARLFNIDYKIAIFFVYLFILYSTFGGYYTVTKTDIFNLVILSISILVIFFLIVTRVGGVFRINQMASEISGFAYDGVASYNEPGSLVKLENTDGQSFIVYISMLCGWGLGLAANPQYTIRIISAKSKSTAKKTLLISILFLLFFYFILIQVGLGVRVLFPTITDVKSKDDVLIIIIYKYLHSELNGFFLISIIGACVSTANSQLLLIASSFSYDLINTLRHDSLSENAILNLSRIGIFLGGTVSLLLSLNPPADTLTYGSNIWGIFSVTLLPGFYGSLLYKRTTKYGVYASVITGIICIFIFFNNDMSVHPAFPSIICSVVVYILVSKYTYRKYGNMVKSNDR